MARSPSGHVLRASEPARCDGAAAPLSSARSRARSASGVEPALDLPVDASEMMPGLFGHDDRHRVVLFGEAERGAVPRAELAAHLAD